MLRIATRLSNAKDRLVKATRKFITGKEEGVTAVEYALIAALIAVVIVGAVTALGNKIAATFNTVTAALP